MGRFLDGEQLELAGAVAEVVHRNAHLIEHGDQEIRHRGGALLGVHQMFQNVDESTCLVRVISARKATKAETRQYESRDK